MGRKERKDLVQLELNSLENQMTAVVVGDNFISSMNTAAEKLETKEKIRYGEYMKKSVIMVAPFNHRSGYGDHVGQYFIPLWIGEDIDIKCIDVKWGGTPRNH